MILMGWSGFSVRVGPNRCLPRGAFCVAEGNWINLARKPLSPPTAIHFPLISRALGTKHVACRKQQRLALKPCTHLPLPLRSRPCATACFHAPSPCIVSASVSVLRFARTTPPASTRTPPACFRFAQHAALSTASLQVSPRVK